MPKVKDKERILKEARKKHRVTYKEVPIILSADLLKKKKQNFAGNKGLARSIQMMKGKGLQPGLLYPAKLPFRMEGQIKCVPDKVKLKDFIVTNPLLHDRLEGFI